MIYFRALLICILVAMMPVPAIALDNRSQYAGTIQVGFRPMETAGIVDGCTLVYHMAEQDFVYRNGKLINIVGNIAFFPTKDLDKMELSLKISTVDTFNETAKPEAPFYAFILTPHGTTAKSKFRIIEADNGESKLFIYELDEGAMAVLKDLLEGQPVTIGFNRREGARDVRAPLDLHVADTIVSSDGSFTRHRTNDAIQQFATCVTDVKQRVQSH